MLWYIVVGLLLVAMALSDSLLQRLPVTTPMLYVAGGLVLGPPLGLGLLTLALVNLTAAVAMVAWVHHSGRVEEEAREEAKDREAHESHEGARVEKTAV